MTWVPTAATILVVVFLVHVVFRHAPRLLAIFVAPPRYPMSDPDGLSRRLGRGWVLITGGTGGIGRALAARVARAGFDVILVGRSGGGVDHTARWLTEKERRGLGRRVESASVDTVATPSKSVPAGGGFTPSPGAAEGGRPATARKRKGAAGNRKGCDSGAGPARGEGAGGTAPRHGGGGDSSGAEESSGVLEWALAVWSALLVRVAHLAARLTGDHPPHRLSGTGPAASAADEARAALNPARGSENPLRVRTVEIDLSVPLEACTHPGRVGLHSSELPAHLGGAAALDPNAFPSTAGRHAGGHGHRDPRGAAASSPGHTHAVGGANTASAGAGAGGAPGGAARFAGYHGGAVPWWMDREDGGLAPSVLPRGSRLAGVILNAGSLEMESFTSAGAGAAAVASLRTSLISHTALAHACVRTMMRDPATHSAAPPAFSLPAPGPGAPTAPASGFSSARGAAEGSADGSALGSVSTKLWSALGPVLHLLASLVGVAGFLADHGGSQPHRRGAVVFMASQTAIWPTPYSPAYAAGKAALRSFATSLAAELPHDCGIDVLSVSPGYVHTRLFSAVPRLWFLRALAFIGQAPEQVAKETLRAVGRVPHLDTGIFTHVTESIVALLGSTAITNVMGVAAAILPDYIYLRSWIARRNGVRR